jgi:predicted enzyme related to lactoylglutathione lyase
LLAADWAKAFAFYGELFDWQKASAAIGPPNTYQLFATGGQTIGGMFSKRPGEPVPYWLYYFNVDDIDAASERVKTGGGQIFEGPIEVPGGNWIARCIDPQGAMFALQGTRSLEAARQAPEAELTWAAKWGGISSRGKIVAKSRR